MHERVSFTRILVPASCSSPSLHKICLYLYLSSIYAQILCEIGYLSGDASAISNITFAHVCAMMCATTNTGCDVNTSNNRKATWVVKLRRAAVVVAAMVGTTTALTQLVHALKQLAQAAT